MAIEEPGVLWRDGVYFYAASNFAKQHLFYPMWGATYELDSPYRIRRDYMDAYMIQYVARGALHFKLRGHHFVAKEGELVLLACREKNDYWSEGTARVKWFHFNGREVGPLLERIYETNGSGHMSTFFGARVEPLIDDILQGSSRGIAVSSSSRAISTAFSASWQSSRWRRRHQPRNPSGGPLPTSAATMQNRSPCRISRNP